MDKVDLQQPLLADVICTRKRRHSVTEETHTIDTTVSESAEAGNGVEDAELGVVPALKQRQLDNGKECQPDQDQGSNAQASEFCLEDFSDEMLFEIFKYLDSWTIMALMNCSTRFEDLLLDRRFWHCIDLSKGPLPLGILEVVLGRSNEKTHTIKMCGPPSNQHVSAEFRQFTLTLKNVFPKLQKELRVMEFQGVSLDFNYIQITDFPSSLKRLVLKDCSVNISDEVKSIFHLIDTHLTGLEELAIEDNDWFEPYYIMALSKLPVLRVLSLKGCKRMFKAVPYGSMAARFGFQKLEVLDLRFTPITNGDLQCFGAIETLKQLLLECPKQQPAREYSVLSSDAAKPSSDGEPQVKTEIETETETSSKTAQDVWRVKTENCSSTGSANIAADNDRPTTSNAAANKQTINDDGKAHDNSQIMFDSYINSSSSQANSSLYVSESDTDNDQSSPKKSTPPTLDQVISLSDPEFNALLNRMVPSADENDNDNDDGESNGHDEEIPKNIESDDAKPSTSKSAAAQQASLNASSAPKHCDDLPSTSSAALRPQVSLPTASSSSEINGTNTDNPKNKSTSITENLNKNKNNHCDSDLDSDCESVSPKTSAAIYDDDERYSSTSPTMFLSNSSNDNLDDDDDDDCCDQKRQMCTNGQIRQKANGDADTSQSSSTSSTSTNSNASSSRTSESNPSASCSARSCGGRMPIVVLQLNPDEAVDAALNAPPPPPPPGPAPRAVFIYPSQQEDNDVARSERMRQITADIRLLHQRRFATAGNNPAYSRFLPRPDQIIYMNPNGPREQFFVLQPRRPPHLSQAAQQAAQNRPRNQFDQVFGHPMFWHMIDPMHRQPPRYHRHRSRSPPDCSQVTDRAMYSFGRATNPVEPGVIWIRNINRSMNNRLERIVLRNYKQITNLTLFHLVQCSPNLVYIDVSGTSVTNEGIRNFQELKPECEVVADHLQNETNTNDDSNDDVPPTNE